MTKKIPELLREEMPTPQRVAAIRGTAPTLNEVLRALRAEDEQCAADAAAVQAEMSKLSARLGAIRRVSLTVEQVALDLLRSEREAKGAMSDAGMYRQDLGDGTTCSLIVSPTTELLCTPDAGDRLPDEFVAIKREPKKAVIKGLILAGQEFPGCTLLVKTWKSNPKAEENVRWGKI